MNDAADKTKRKRGAYQRADCHMVTFCMPRAWLPEVDRAVVMSDLDRSKLFREAVREKLERMGLSGNPAPSGPAQS
jgi:hypothetical protein